MTCSWGDFSTTNRPNQLELCSSCDSNFLTWATVTPEQPLELSSSVCSVKDYEHTQMKFRVALIAIDTTEIDFSYYFFNPKAERYLDSLKQQPHRYIWSNEIQLERGIETSYLESSSWKKGKLLTAGKKCI